MLELFAHPQTMLFHIHHLHPKISDIHAESEWQFWRQTSISLYIP